MLSVKLLDSLSDVTSLECFSREPSDVRVITPHPQAADDLRTRLQMGNSSASIEVLTISRFVSDLAADLELSGELKRKAELMLQLATIWKLKAKQVKADYFIQAYNLLTELRSYSTQQSLFDELWEQLPDDLAEVVRFFWTYLDQQDFYDEHRIYGELSSRLKASHSTDLPETIVLWGFDHLNGNQVDFFKTLSIWSHVILPVRRVVFEQSQNSDYLKWMAPDQVDAVESAYQKETKPLPCLYFPKNRLAESLKPLEGQYEKILITDKTLSWQSLSEIPFFKGHFKVEANMFEGALREIEEEMRAQDHSWSSEAVDQALEQMGKTALSSQDFRRYKVITLLQELLGEYSELSSANEQISDYDIDILIHVCELCLPRVYSAPLFYEQKCEVFDLRAMERIGRNNKLLVLISSQYASLLPNSKGLPYEVRHFLSQIGPMRSGELELVNLMEGLKDIVYHNEVLLMIEEGLEKVDYGWKSFLDQWEMAKQTAVPYQKLTTDDPLKLADGFDAEIVKKPSASRLQNYKECPRKYYYTTVEPIQNEIPLESDLSPQELGTLEHKLIQAAFEQGLTDDGPEYRRFIEQRVDEEMELLKKDLEINDRYRFVEEVRVYVLNGLRFVHLFESSYPDCRVRFEVNLAHDLGVVDRSGSIDLLVETSKGVFLIDFKRSKGSIPSSLNKLFEFEKIQLWFYALRLDELEKKVLGMGYFNLSDPDDSLLIQAQEEIVGMGFVPPKKQSWIQALNEYRELELDLIQRINSDKTFLAKPEKSDSCRFCPVQILCSRGEA